MVSADAARRWTLAPLLLWVLRPYLRRVVKQFEAVVAQGLRSGPGPSHAPERAQFDPPAAAPIRPLAPTRPENGRVPIRSGPIPDVGPQPGDVIASEPQASAGRPPGVPWPHAPAPTIQQSDLDAPRGWPPRRTRRPADREPPHGCLTNPSEIRQRRHATLPHPICFDIGTYCDNSLGFIGRLRVGQSLCQRCSSPNRRRVLRRGVAQSRNARSFIGTGLRGE